MDGERVHGGAVDEGEEGAPHAPSLDERVMAALEQGWNDVAALFPDLADLVCPLSGRVMTDPVRASDGYTYERTALQAWIDQHAPDEAPSPIVPMRAVHMLGGNPQRREAVEALVEAASEALPTGEQRTIQWDPHGAQAVDTPRSVEVTPRQVQRNLDASFLQAATSSSPPAAAFSPPTLRTPHVAAQEAAERAFTDLAESLSRIFTVLDPIRDVLAEVLDGWTPPQIVVIGDESAGKSTVLEQLTMFPVFPRSRRFCTRCAIHLRLRRMTIQGESVARISVHHSSNMHPVDPARAPETIPLSRGFEYVQRKMDELVSGLSEGNAPLINDRVIVLEIVHPTVPSVDLIDLPGLTQHPPTKAQLTRAIIEEQVRKDRATGSHAMYLAIVPAGGEVRPCTNSAMAFVDGQGLRDRTIGVFTKCDHLAHPDILHSLVTGENTSSGETPADFGAVPLEKGWVASMLRVPQAQSMQYYETHALERLYEQKRQEEAFFRASDDEHLRDLYNRKAAGISALVLRLERQYSSYLNSTWKNMAVKKVFARLDKAEFELDLLGRPAQSHSAAVEELERRLTKVDDLYKRFFYVFLGLNNCGKMEGLKHELKMAAAAVVQKYTTQRGGHISIEAQHLQKFLRDLNMAVGEVVNDSVDRMADFWLSALREMVYAKPKVKKNPNKLYNVVTEMSNMTFEYFRSGFQTRRQMYQGVKEQPMVQLEHYPAFAMGILQRYKEAFSSSRFATLRNHLQHVVKDAFTTRYDNLEFIIPEANNTQDPRVFTDPNVKALMTINTGLCDQMLFHKLFPALVQGIMMLIPGPDRIKVMHEGIGLGVESSEAASDRQRHQAEVEKVRRALDSLRKAFEMSDEEIAKLRAEVDRETV